MTKEKFINLKPGDKIMHEMCGWSGVIYIVDKVTKSPGVLSVICRHGSSMHSFGAYKHISKI